MFPPGVVFPSQLSSVIFGSFLIINDPKWKNYCFVTIIRPTQKFESICFQYICDNSFKPIYGVLSFVKLEISFPREGCILLKVMNTKAPPPLGK
jgi:hypothetical protein